MENTLAELFRDMSRKHRNAVRDYLGKYGLYIGQHHILFLLEDIPTISQKEMCEQLKVSKESLSVSLKRLEFSGLVVREVDLEDRRRVLWTLSDKGKDLAVKCHCGFKKINESMFSHLESHEQEAMKIFLNKMIDGLDEGEENETIV